MISKGTTHNNGARLADYMTTGKDGERAELWQLKGFEAINIKDAFRDVQIMAGATKCEQPFFHVQLRNREGETLTRQQWEHAADRIGQMLGLGNQPRAIAFHIDEKTNHEHMHVAWSRIDEDTLTVTPLPFFKLRLKKISRELELHFGLEPVTNHREGNIKFAPTRAEDEQARRLGLDPHELRDTIRNCWDRSDCGRSFQSALEHEGMTLAQGDQRGFVVVDRAGGLHVLSKRILDVTASKIRERISDLSRGDLPTVEMTRAFIRENSEDRQREPQREKPEQVWDRDRADRKWQHAVVEAAIEKEKTERQFVESHEREAKRDAGSRKEKDWPLHPLVTEPVKTSPELHFDDAAKAATKDKTYIPPRKLTGMSARIDLILRTLQEHPELIKTEVKTLSAVLDDQGIALAQVTKAEADRSHRESEFAKAIGHSAPRYREGEIVAVTEPPLEHRRHGQIIVPNRVRRLDQTAALRFVASLDRGSLLQGVEDTKQTLNVRAIQRAEHWEAVRLESATNIKDFSRELGKSEFKQTLHKTVSVASSAANKLGKTLDAVGDALASLFAPALTPKQVHEAADARDRREADAERGIDFSRFTAEDAVRSRQLEDEREAQRQQSRERGGRER